MSSPLTLGLPHAMKGFAMEADNGEIGSEA